jgi:hypothetical protein
MFTSIENNTTQMMQMMYKMQFNRNALFKDEFAALIMSLIICYLVVEFMSDVICTNISAKIDTKYKNEHKGLIDDLNKRDDEIQALLIEICNLHEEVKMLKETKAATSKAATSKEATSKEATSKEATNQEAESGNPCYQCDKCFNKYDSQDMEDLCIIGNMLQHYCKECYETIDDDVSNNESNDD